MFRLSISKILKRKDKSRGFTLIELLIVISIIGILSAFIFVILSSAKNAAREKSILSELKAMQNHANLYLVFEDTYGVPHTGSSCDSGFFADPEFLKIKDSIVLKSSGLSTCAVGYKGQTFAYQIISSQFETICVDNLGISRNEISWSFNTQASCQF